MSRFLDPTHYVPAFTRTNRYGSQAACGTFIPMSLHSTEPTCQTCKDYLEADAATDAAMEAMAAEYRNDAKETR